MPRTILGLLALAALLAPAVPARAGMIPAAVTVSPDGGHFRYKYHIDLPTDYRVKSGDFFTIYDFHGYAAGGNVQPAGWVLTSSLLGPNPPHIIPTDDPLTPNLTWTWTGSTISGAADLGVFEAISTIGPHMEFTDFGSKDHNIHNDRAVGNYTSVASPDPVPPAEIPSAPEPTTLAMLGLGLPLAGLAAWLNRRAAR